MNATNLNLVNCIAQLLNPGDYLILPAEVARIPSGDPQLRVILPSGIIFYRGLRRGVSGNHGWNGNPLIPILYGRIVTAAWAGWIQATNGVSQLISDP